jgi:methylthioribose-1-phosphate isomerase
MKVATLYFRNGALYVLDQLLLPRRKKYIACRNAGQVARVIRKMNIRGAPAIGVAAAFGLALGAADFKGQDKKQFWRRMDRVAGELAGTRPTAVNIHWALGRLRAFLRQHEHRGIVALKKLALEQAQEILKEDVAINKNIARRGEKLIPRGARILTHCNAGALATAGYGTALGVIREAHKKGKRISVLVDETRPYLQGARLTAWELKEEKIPFHLISDNMAGFFMSRGEVDCVITGADRVVANGDTANKIGTYSLAVLARENKIPFYIAAPLSSIDLEKKQGSAIPIEERSAEEVTMILGRRIAPEGIKVKNPAFDVTPAKYITAIITEEGIARPPFKNSLRKLINNSRRSH